VNICTIIARNYVAHARVLAESFQEHHPEGTCSVLVIDDPAGYIDAAGEPFELLTIDQIGLLDPERMAASYDVMELSTAVKPWLLRTLLERPGVDSVAYLDPDIKVFASLAEIDRRAQEHDVVLTPHFTKPLPRDERKPSEEDILIAGTYNLGFIALSPGETATALLDWWSERLEAHCLNEPTEGRFVDQRWIDLAPGLWQGIDVLRDPSYNIAYWNLPTRQLEDAEDGGYRVDGLPLHFFHFSGFDPRTPEELSKHQDRIEIAAGTPLARICREYAAELLEHGFEEANGWSYGWAAMENGIELDWAARSILREAVEANDFDESVFTQAGADRFAGYLRERAADSAVPLNRYAKALWDSRPDLQATFPNIQGDSAPAFADWLRVTGPEDGVPVALVPAKAPSVNGAGPAPKRRRIEPGVNVVGYLSDPRGVGEAARQLLSALSIGETPTATIDTPTEPDKIHDQLADLPDQDHPYDFNLICVNADMLPVVATALGGGFFEGRHTTGLWFWEVSHFPEMWRGAFEYVDEVWVASEHVASALRPLSSTPVYTIRVPITPVPPAEMSREELGMPEGFCFLFVFDYRSIFKRKNPLGLVEAFCRAFEPGEGPSLVIKSICGDEFPAEQEALAAAVRDRPEIHLIGEMVPVAAKNAMVANCDCYVSLHRSEGLGLTIAEAMYFGKPVIATGYSGNLDFMTGRNSYVVPHTMVEIGSGAEPYPADKTWAEPDLDVAAELMKKVFEEPAEAARRGWIAAEDIHRTHSPEAAREVLEQRIDQVRRGRIYARLQPPTPAQAQTGAAEGGRTQLEHLLHFSDPPPRRGTGDLRASAKRLYMRLLRPYVAYQQRVNASTAESLDELREMLSETVKMEAAIDRRLIRTEQKLERLVDVEERLARADELVAAAAAKPYMADDRLRTRTVPALGTTIGFRTGLDEGAGDGYRGFEDLFRGSEEMIRDRQRIYMDLVAGRGPVLDAGCGRGEFLDLLREKGIEARGVDLDRDQVARCREKGHEVEEGDLLEVLERTPEGSLGAIFSAQVIEHIPYEQLQRFLELGVSRLRPGGLLIAETVNPHSAAALKAFWVDPTHQHPLFPETVLALCALAGYAAGDVFAPVGTGDWDLDRTRVGEYAVVAVAPEGGAAGESS
jgi:glycosyltransferase involved in cell wall biosynthesis/SAM-dependent methyltransferase